MNTTDNVRTADTVTAEAPSVTVTDETVTVKRPHLFRRAREAANNNPIKTAVGASLAIGAAAFAGLNYNRYGSPLGTTAGANDLVEVVGAAASLFAKL